MNVTKHIICELTGYRPGVVDVSQGDRGSRAVSCRLLESGAPWIIPEGASVRVAYTLPDGTEGLYDALPDGSPAGEIVGNIVTVELADQLMDQAGMAQVSILLIGPDGGQLATWPIRVMVSANKAARLTVPENMPTYGAGFAGKIFFGGADGTVTPLELGDGVEIVRQEDGSYALVAYGGAGGGIQEEKDPTVPDWAKQANKPSYTAQEVGALPAGTKIPAKTSDLSNDSGFINKSVADLTNYYTKTQTEDLIAQIPKFRISVVQQLPAAGEERVLYLVPFATAEGQYLEYIWVGGRFEVIGSQKVDLTGYATESWVQAGYQPKGDYAPADSVPTKVSQLANDAGYLTQHQDISHLLPRNLGAENVGKVLVVGGDGNIVLTELPQVGDVTGTLDGNNNILLSGDLTEGTYTLKWRNADGTYLDAGTIVVAPVEPAYTNQIPISTEADGSPYNGGQGWKTDWRLSASSGSESSAPGVEVTGFIPYVMADENIYIKGIEDDGTHAMVAYDEAHTKVWNIALGNFGAALDGSVEMLDVDDWMSQGIGLEQRESVRYIRICANVINDKSILTVNEPIS